MKSIKVTGIAAALLLAGCASSPAPRAVQVPDSLNPGAQQALAAIVPAKGVQIYECRAGKDGALDWAFVAPEATLYDVKGKPIGRHYAGPHWEASDGSKIVARLKARADAPEASSIPWLLLEAKSVGGTGAFSKVTSIQRVATVGGIAPARECPQAGARARIGYTADYYFFRAK